MKRLISVVPIDIRGIEFYFDDGSSIELEAVERGLIGNADRNAICDVLETFIDERNGEDPRISEVIARETHRARH